MTLLLVAFVNNSFASVRHKGVINSIRNDFYFTGYNLYLWSGRKPEFKNKYNVIYKYNFESKIKETFFTGDCVFRDLTMSPVGNYLGVRCTDQGKSDGLIILNLKGEKVLEIPGSIREYVWHPDSDKLMYMTGNITYRGDEVVINPTGIWLYDMKEKTKTKIAEKGWNIRRESFDKHIYFWNGEKIVRYNVDSMKIEETNLKNEVEYSPDHRYYVYYLNVEDERGWEEPYWSPFRIFDTKENKDLSPEKISFLSERNPGDIVWGKDSKKIIFRGNVSKTIGEQRIYIYDLEGNQVIKQFHGEMVGFSDDRTALVIYRDGEFFLEKIPVARDSR